MAPLWAAPKLIVAISVEDMEADYLQKFEGEFTDGGFRKLTSGERYENVEFSYITTDYATDIATLFTGTNPCFHGIIGEKRYSADELNTINSLLDKGSYGLNDDWKLGGDALKSITFADQLNEDSFGYSKIVAVSANPTTAMLMAGHSGLPLYMNNLTGKWSTSSYYCKSMPQWLNEFNIQSSIDGYLDSEWENIQHPAFYTMSSANSLLGFRYHIRRACNGVKLYDNFTTTPQCNDYICDLALKAVEGEKMGINNDVDLLMISFSLKQFYLKSGEPYSLELEDAYIRLDKTLVRLIEALENRVGKGNALFMLISSRTGQNSIKGGVNKKIKYQQFSIEKYSTLLNSYLKAHYGENKWILNCGSGNIYLNNEEIEKKGLKLRDVQETAKEFFYMIPGILNLCSNQQMEEAFYSTGNMRYAYFRGASGDILYSLMPRWYEVDMKGNPTGYSSSYKTSVSAWIYGDGHTTLTVPYIKATELIEKLH